MKIFLVAVEESLEYELGNPSIWNLKGHVCRTLNRKKESLAAFSRSIDLLQEPTNQINRPVESAIYLFNRAGLYCLQGQFEKARGDVEKARHMNNSLVLLY